MEADKNSVASDATGDWPTLLHDNMRSGGMGLQNPHAPNRPRWQFRAGRSIRAAPVLRDKVLYVISVDGTLYAIDVVTGRSKFTFQAPKHVHSTPSLWASLIFFGCDDGRVFALNCNSGTKSGPRPSCGRKLCSLEVRTPISMRLKPRQEDSGGQPTWAARSIPVRQLRMESCSLDVATESYIAWTPPPGKLFGALQPAMASTPHLRFATT